MRHQQISTHTYKGGGRTCNMQSVIVADAWKIRIVPCWLLECRNCFQTRNQIVWSIIHSFWRSKFQLCWSNTSTLQTTICFSSIRMMCVGCKCPSVFVKYSIVGKCSLDDRITLKRVRFYRLPLYEIFAFLTDIDKCQRWNDNYNFKWVQATKTTEKTSAN